MTLLFWHGVITVSFLAAGAALAYLYVKARGIAQAINHLAANPPGWLIAPKATQDAPLILLLSTQH